MRPTTSCLDGKHRNSSPAKSSREVWIRQLFPLAGLLESGTILLPLRNGGVGDHWPALEKPRWCPQRAGHHRTVCNDIQAAGVVAGNGEGAKEVKKTATPVGARGQRQGKPQAMEEQLALLRAHTYC